MSKDKEQETPDELVLAKESLSRMHARLKIDPKNTVLAAECKVEEARIDLMLAAREEYNKISKQRRERKVRMLEDADKLATSRFEDVKARVQDLFTGDEKATKDIAKEITFQLEVLQTTVSSAFKTGMSCPDMVCAAQEQLLVVLDMVRAFSNTEKSYPAHQSILNLLDTVRFVKVRL